MTAKAVDPGTLLAAAEGGYKIWKGLQEARKKEKIIAELGKITDLLHDVIKRQDQILTELKNLRIHIREDMRAEFLFALDAELHEIMRRVETQMGRLPSVNRRVVLNTLVNEGFMGKIESIVWRMDRYGASAVTGSLAAAIYFVCFIGLLRELGANRRSVDSTEQSFLKIWDQKFFGVWLDENQLGSLIRTISEISREKQDIKTKIDNHPRRVPLGFHRTHRRVFSHGYFCDRGADHFLIISGDLEHGFTGSIVLENSRLFDCEGGSGYGGHPPFLPGQIESESSSSEADSGEDVQEVYPDEDVLTEQDVAIVENEASDIFRLDKALEEAYRKEGISKLLVDHEIVNGLNTQVRQWKTLVEQEARLRVLIAWVEEIRRSFEERRGELR
jgi:hypothetical protein